VESGPRESLAETRDGGADVLGIGGFAPHRRAGAAFGLGQYPARELYVPSKG
jgi:hypothetical protein